MVRVRGESDVPSCRKMRSERIQVCVDTQRGRQRVQIPPGCLQGAEHTHVFGCVLKGLSKACFHRPLMSQVPKEWQWCLIPAVKGFHLCNKPHFIPFLNCIISA